jgi:hypothetical protein
LAPPSRTKRNPERSAWTRTFTTVLFGGAYLARASRPQVSGGRRRDADKGHVARDADPPPRPSRPGGAGHHSGGRRRQVTGSPKWCGASGGAARRWAATRTRLMALGRVAAATWGDARSAWPFSRGERGTMGPKRARRAGVAGRVTSGRGQETAGGVGGRRGTCASEVSGSRPLRRCLDSQHHCPFPPRRSSNRACGFPAYGSRTDFTPEHATSRVA